MEKEAKIRILGVRLAEFDLVLKDQEEQIKRAQMARLFPKSPEDLQEAEELVARLSSEFEELERERERLFAEREKLFLEE